MSSRKRTTVMIVDDNPVVRSGLGAIVSYQDDLVLVGNAATAAEASVLFAAYSPDVTVIDLSLPGQTGIELITDLRSRLPHAKFLVLTGRVANDQVNQALQAGADTFLFKNVPSETLLAAIRGLCPVLSV